MTPSDEAARSVDCELTATSEAQPTEFVTSRRGVLLAALASAFLPTRRLVARAAAGRLARHASLLDWFPPEARRILLTQPIYGLAATRLSHG